jgi:AraC-like DNA-binding protein
VRTHPVRFTQGYASEVHAHAWHQLSYASAGVLRVATAGSAWIVPPHRAVWIPAGVEHSEEIRGQGTMRSLYFASAVAKRLPRDCVVMTVPALLRELILEATAYGALDAKVGEQRRLAQVIVDRIARLSPASSQNLPMPSDARALAIAQRLMKAPANGEPIETLARRAGASKRTAQRLFAAETGMSFAAWRQRLRLLSAIERLERGRSVTDAAFDVGYTSVSAFVSAFRREFGVTPGRFAGRAP